VERDDRGRRRRVGERIEAYLKERTRGRPTGPVGWTFAGPYAVREVAMRILFREFYRGRFGARSEALGHAMTEIALKLEREFERICSGIEPDIFEQVVKRLANEVEEARLI